MKVQSLSRVRLLATPWTAAHQAPPSMGLSRQEHWSGLPSPSLHVPFVLLLICPQVPFPPVFWLCFQDSELLSLSLAHADQGDVVSLFIQHLAHSRCWHVLAVQLYSFIRNTVLNT